MPRTTIKRAIKSIKQELEWWEPKLIEEGKLLEAQRLHQRTMFDLEMLKEMGFCRGIENYSRHLTGKKEGEPPPTLLDYLPRDTMVVIDESHQRARRRHAEAVDVLVNNCIFFNVSIGGGNICFR